MALKKVQRNTQQRQVILEELCKVNSHPTAAGLFEIVRQRLPGISLATVYRNLERLSELGLVLKLDLGGGQARYDGTPQPHDHVRCVRCGRVDDLRLVPVEAGGEGPLEGYEVLGRRLEFFGICPQCRKHEPSQPHDVRETQS